MHIILVEKNERLLDQYSPLIEGQLPGVAEKIRQQNRGAQLLPDRLSRRAQKGWGLVRHSTIYCVFHCHIPPPITEHDYSSYCRTVRCCIQDSGGHRRT